LAGQVLSGVKWWLLGSSVGLARPIADYVRFYFIGMSLNVFGLSTIGGDVVRALYLGNGRRPALALNSVVFDRMNGLAILMALGAAGHRQGARRPRAPRFSAVPPAVGAQRRPDRWRARSRRVLVALPQAGAPAAAAEPHPPSGGARPRAVLARPPVARRGQRAL